MKISLQQKIQIALIVFLIVLNVFGYNLVKSYVDQVSTARLDLASQDIKNQIEGRLSDYTNVLVSAAALFSASEKVTKNEWTNYVQKLQINKTYPGFQVLSYAPQILPENIEAYKNKLSDYGINSFKIYPDTVTPIYAPVLYSEPASEEVNKVVGLNLYSDPIRKPALEFARDNNAIAVTNKLTPLVKKAEDKDGDGVAMYYPVYKNGADISTQESRRENILGFVVAGIKPDELMKNLTLKAVPNLDFQIFDNSDNGGFIDDSLLFNSGSDRLITPGFAPRFSSKETIIFPNTNWYIRFTAIPDSQLATFSRYSPYIIALLDLVSSILLLIFVRRLLDMYLSANKQTRLYAEKLIYEDALVDDSDRGVIMTNEYGRITVFNKRAEQILGYQEVEVINKMDFLNLISKSELEEKIQSLQKRTGINIKQDFDAVITDCLLDGKEDCHWGLINKAGQPRRTDIVLRPVYDNKNQLLGYKFTF